MSSTADIIFHAAEAVSAISLPVGGGLAAYAKWRRNAERDRRAREETARIAAEKAAKDARLEEQGLRDRLLQEKESRIQSLTQDLATARTEVESLHGQIFSLLREANRKAGNNEV